MSHINRNQDVAKSLSIEVSALSGVTQDSRKCAPGCLFAALVGAHDGRSYIPNALDAGATTLLTDSSVLLEGRDGVQHIKADRPRKAFAHIVGAFYNAQPELLVAVTGTNGKSSVAHFVDQLWRSVGYKSSFIGTLSGAMTTPDPESLHAQLSSLKRSGVDHVIMEASSHGLEQCRVDGANISVAAFTSFSQDHLDYHEDMDAYLGAKSRLFSEVLLDDGVAVLNADIPEYDVLKTLCDARGIKVLSYGYKADDIQLVSVTAHRYAQDIFVNVQGVPYTLHVPLVGKFQVMNVLCALGCVIARGEPVQQYIGALSTIKGVPGRLQHVMCQQNQYHAFVDYAHTPDALEVVLSSLRSHISGGRLICVFGCGGDRDTTKRPLMGEIAARLSDVAILTDDNPRSEEPASIRAQVRAGMDGQQCEVIEIEQGRDVAISKAIEMMQPRDLVLVAGKGHEQGQVFAGFSKEFDDASEVEKALRLKAFV